MEIINLVDNIHIDNSEFVCLVDFFEPLINKYCRLLYKDEKDDVRSEMILALWEAVIRIKYNSNNGQCMNYICTSLRYKFLELYRKSRTRNDNYVLVDINELHNISVKGNVYDEINFYYDMRNFLSHFQGSKVTLYEEIIFENQGDSQIAIKYNMSRQYVNRARRKLYSKLREIYYIYGNVA